MSLHSPPMKLHEIRQGKSSDGEMGVQCTRVPNGYLYQIWDWDKDGWGDPCFVPE